MEKFFENTCKKRKKEECVLEKNKSYELIEGNKLRGKKEKRVESSKTENKSVILVRPNLFVPMYSREEHCFANTLNIYFPSLFVPLL